MDLYDKNEFIYLLKDTFSILKYEKNHNKIIYLLTKVTQGEKDFNTVQCQFINYLNVTKHIIANFNKNHGLKLITTLDRFYTVCSNDNGGFLLQEKLWKAKKSIINRNKGKVNPISTINKRKIKNKKNEVVFSNEKLPELENKNTIQTDNQTVELFKLIEQLKI